MDNLLHKLSVVSIEKNNFNATVNDIILVKHEIKKFVLDNADVIK